MKILHVIRDMSPATGGPVTAIRGLAAVQRNCGHEVVVVSTDHGLPEQVQESEFEFQACRCTVAAWRYAPEMRGVLKKRIAWSDVVHVHTLWEHPTLAAVSLARKMGKPFVLRPCGMLDQWSMSQSPLKKRLYLSMFSRALFAPPCVLHFTSDAEREKSSAPLAPSEVVIENGISDRALSSSTPTAFLTRFPTLHGKRIVLFLSRVHPKKRPDIAIAAFARGAAAHPDAVLVIGGPCSDHYRAELRKLAASAGIIDRILFTGMLAGDELYGAYRAASLFVLPSMQENFGIAVAEAMAASCPVVISEHVDIKQRVIESDAGIVCEANVGDFAKAIERLLANPAKAAAMGANGRSVCEKHFTWERAAEKLDALYQGSIRNMGK